MNSKILNPNLYQLSQLKKSITRWIYSASQSKLNDKKLSSPSSSPINSQLLLNNSNNRFQLTQVRWTLRGGAGYTKFGHGKIKPKISKYGYFWYAILATGFLFVAFFDTESFMFRGREPSMRLEEMKQWYSTHSNSKAKEIDSSTKVVDEDQLISEESQLNDDIVSELSDDDAVDNVKEKKEKITFRNRKIIQYENRIRQYSTPDKIFRYFATLSVWNEKLDDYEVYMTPEDFVRSITYGAKQPEGLGLDRYIRFDPQMQKLETNIGDDSIFRILNRQGIISFTDYIFLLTLLSTPTRHFEIAFYMFDEDGSGNIDLAEFEQLQAIIRSQTSSGQRHRDTRMTGSVIKDNHHLNEYFFGKELSELLTVDKFVSFQRRLQAEVIRMEFELCNLRTRESDGERVMSEMTFAEMILAYAGLGPSKTKKMLKKIASLYEGENSKQSKGITLRDYEDFFQILRSIHDIDTALKFYSIAGASIDKSILKHVSKTVANINLSDHVIDVIFNLFDENGDGKLTQKEFIKVMKKRWSRGLQQPKDTGFVKFIEALIMCSKEAVLSSPS